MGGAFRKTDPQAEAQVNQLLDQNPVMIFSKSYCPFCTKTKQLLNNGGVAYKVVELDRDANGAAMQDVLAK